MLFGTAEEVLARPTETQTFVRSLPPRSVPDVRLRRVFSPDAAARHPKSRISRPSDTLFAQFPGPGFLRCTNLRLYAKRVEACRKLRNSPEKHIFEKLDRHKAFLKNQC